MDRKRLSLRNAIRVIKHHTRIAEKLYHSLLSDPPHLIEMEKLSV